MIKEVAIRKRDYSYCTEFTPTQSSVLLGTMLGDGNLQLSRNNRDRNAQLKWSHGRFQHDYLQWKLSTLRSVFNYDLPRLYLRTQRGKRFWTCYAASRKHPLLTERYNQFYTRPDNECTKHIHKKRITQQILDQVDDLALAVWFCDDGTNAQSLLQLILGGADKQEYNLIGGWLNSRGLLNTPHPIKGVNGVTLNFVKGSSRLLAEKVRPYIPQCMQYKLMGFLPGERWSQIGPQGSRKWQVVNCD